MDSEEQPDLAAHPSPEDGAAPALGNAGDSSEADPASDHEAGPGSAPMHPPASDAYGRPDDNVGDFTTPDVDLSHLVPSSDGDPDDEEDLVEEGRALASEREDLIAAGADPSDLLTPIHPDDAADYHEDGRRGSWGTAQ